MKLGFCLALVCLAFSISVRAENTAAAPASTDGDSALAAAKQTFESQQRPNAANESRTELPRLTAPEFAAPAPASIPKRATPKLQKSGKDNWLVDGVMDVKRDETGAADKDSDLVKPKEKNRNHADDTKASADESTSSLVIKNAPNPLGPYMNAWISAQDRSLLQGNLAMNPASAPIEGFGLLNGPSASRSPVASIGAAPSSSGLPPVVPQNPYLESARSELTSPVGTSTSAGKIEHSLRSLPTAVAPAATVNPGNLPARLDVEPELNRAADDQKYFKQLNRF